VRTSSARWAAAASLLAVVAGGCAETGEPSVSSLTGAHEFRTGDPVTQTFVATNDDLMLVRVWIATYGVAAPSGTLTATLSDDTGPIREVELFGPAVVDLRAQSIVFDPVPDSGGRTFEIALEWEGADRTGVLYNAVDVYPDGEASIGGDLRFEVGTADRFGAVVGVASSSVGHVVDAVGRDPAFWIVWLVGLFSLGWLARRRGARVDEPSREPAES
jgi:hypothetical protein